MAVLGFVTEQPTKTPRAVIKSAWVGTMPHMQNHPNFSYFCISSWYLQIPRRGRQKVSESCVGEPRE